jgi:tetratricopeptide (TPR) repeat protein
LDKQNYDAVIADMNRAIELGSPISADAYCLRGTGWAGKGDFQKAIADSTTAIELNPRHALAYNNRANDKLRMRDYDGALADCNKSIALDPNSPLAYYNRGYAYSNKGHASKAIADWTKAMQMQPGYRAELEPLIVRLREQGAR